MPDGLTPMRAFWRAFDALIDGLAALAGLAVAAMTGAMVVNIAMRFLGGRGIFGLVEAVELSLMAITFLAAPWVLKHNAHVAVDLVLTMLSAEKRAQTERATAIIGAVLSLILAWCSLSALLIAYARGSTMRGVLPIPEWIMLAAPVFGGVLLAVQFLRMSAYGHTARSDPPAL